MRGASSLKGGVHIMRKLLCVAALFGGFLLPVTPQAEAAPVVVTSPHHYYHHYRHHYYGHRPYHRYYYRGHWHYRYR